MLERDRYQIISLEDEGCSWPWYRKFLPQWLGMPVGILAILLALRGIMLLWIAIQRNNDQNTFVACCYLVIQITLFLAHLVENGWRMLCIKSRKRACLRLVGNEVPAVDVIITTCGEDSTVIMDSVRAACNLDYPYMRFRVLVTDDKADKALEERVKKLALKVPVPLLYYARPGENGSKSGAKAGNMNAALEYLDGLETPAGFCAFVDADMILERAFLRACMPHLLCDREAGMVVVPQSFYNVPTNDPLFQSLNPQAKYDEVLRDSINSTWNTGPGTIFRRSALKDIRGFPEDALSEDIMSGFMLQGRGWNLIYCNEALQWGLVPDTLRGHLTQRIKWSVGTLRNACKLNFCFHSRLLEYMTRTQRLLAFFHCALPVASSMNRVLCSWFLLCLLASGQPLVATTTTEELHQLIRLNFFTNMVFQLETLLASSRCGYLALRQRSHGLRWLSPCLFFAQMRDLVPTRFGGTRIRFIPTATAESRIQERNPDHRPPLLNRAWIMFRYQYLWYHTLMLSLTFIILFRGISQSMSSATPIQHLLTHVFPGAEWQDYVAWFMPIVYAIWPPSMPQRRDLMQVCSEDLKSDSNFLQEASQEFSIWRPKPERKVEDWDSRALLPEIPQVVNALFWCAIYLDVIKIGGL
ncbi:glycosyltransferase family 2 protein [Collybiopsis luxurians FD-317 M1]|uniref:Glycosyltransferase family 2 protein n=1 Tax=Collybiopsis luxurians FD-317 M1 TaxID=944289 RepID=A0A0D0BQX6_9AGAR|nr:glycosyltransferase family 2 protein [Collybiopsis luxurians FD-317 M1]